MVQEKILECGDALKVDTVRSVAGSVGGQRVVFIITTATYPDTLFRTVRAKFNSLNGLCDSLAVM